MTAEITLRAGDPDTCDGCGAEPGTYHLDNCDHAACPGCGEQLLMCGDCCAQAELPARWHGTDQRAAVARHFGWWTTAAGIDHPVEDYTRVLFAIALGQITWDRDRQHYTIGVIDEAALTAAITASQ